MNTQPAEGKICAILQPTFLPWLGWFDLADQADILVILDDVAFSKQSWQQRNRIRTPRGLEMLSVPVNTAGRLGQHISECELKDQRFAKKMLGSLRANYARAPWSADALQELEAVMTRAAASGKLLDLNCALINWIAQRLEVRTPARLSSALGAGGQRGEHVAAICEALGASHYLSPAGAENYLIEDRHSFDLRRIQVWIQVYDHPVYTQRFEPFLPYACSLDLIFNEGPNAPAVMRAGRRPPRQLGSAHPSTENRLENR